MASHWLQFMSVHNSRFPLPHIPYLGVYAAAHDLDIEWIVIKGISDYADGSEPKTNSWRSFASLMAASLTAHILSDTIVFQDLSHYESASEYFCLCLCAFFYPCLIKIINKE